MSHDTHKLSPSDGAGTPIKGVRGSLRARAEALLDKNAVLNPTVSTLDAQRIVYELQVHQIELELQREEIAQANIRLEEARERYADLYDLAPVGYVSLDDKGLIVEANLAACSMLGVDRRMLLVKLHLESFLSPESISDWRSHVTRIYAGHGKVTAEVMIVPRGKAPIAVRLDSVDIGTTTGARCSIALMDITEAKQARYALENINATLERGVEQRTAELRESEQALSLALESTQLATWDRDLGGNGLRVNDRWLEMLGYKPGELNVDARLWFSLVHPDDLPALGQAIDDHLKGRTSPMHAEFRMRSKSDEWVWIESHGKIVARDTDGNPTRVIGTHRDITSRRQASAKLEEYQRELRMLANQVMRAEESERRRLAVDLHDGLGQLLNLARIKLGTLPTKGGIDALGPKLAEIARLLNQAVQAASTMTFELSPPVLYELGLLPALRWLAEMLERRYGLKVQVHEELRLYAPDEQIAIVLFRCARELLINVAKHAQTKDAILSICMDEQAIHLSVHDSGVGFDAGRKHSPVRANKGDGSFGLFSVRERVRYLGGNMHMSSAPGQGTTVRVSIPRQVSIDPPAGES